MTKTRIVSQDIGDASILPADLDVSADNTTADSTTGHHGLLPKLGGGSSNFLRADGTWAAPSGSGAPASVDYLVGTADGGLSAEIVVGTTPGGELGGTWASPTVDEIHSGTPHTRRMRLASGHATVATHTNFQDTALAFSVAASTTYYYKFLVFFFTNATSVGIRLALNGPAMTDIRFGALVQTGTAANDQTISMGAQFALDTPAFATTTGPGVNPSFAILEGTCIVGGSGGTLTLRHASETNTQTDIEAGSYAEITQIV